MTHTLAQYVTGFRTGCFLSMKLFYTILICALIAGTGVLIEGCATTNKVQDTTPAKTNDETPIPQNEETEKVEKVEKVEDIADHEDIHETEEIQLPPAVQNKPEEVKSNNSKPLPAILNDEYGEYSASTVIVSLADGADVQGIADRHNLSVLYDLKNLRMAAYKTAQPLTAQQMDLLIAELEADKQVLSAQRDYIMHAD